MNFSTIVRRARLLSPGRMLMMARRIFLRSRSIFYSGDTVYCPCCSNYYSAYIYVGVPPRRAACPGCDSRERQRLLSLYLRDQTNLFDSRLRVLHIAPEDCLQSTISVLANLDYVSADIASPTAMVRMDITEIPFPDESFDVILCSHVLEHVIDDRKAMLELRRILKPGGWAVLQVPVDATREDTFEDPRIVDPEERARHFGQWDHVRVYGQDYTRRLESVGFQVEVVPYSMQLGLEKIQSCGLDATECIHHCRRVR